MGKANNKQSEKSVNYLTNKPNNKSPDNSVNKADLYAIPADCLQRLLGSPDYTPTALQVRFTMAFINDKSGMSPTALLRAMGNDDSNWYYWLADHKGFKNWFDSVVYGALTTDGLRAVHRAMYREALKDSAQDRKLFLQRFDKDYAERSTSDSTHTFKGFVPPASEAVQQSKDLQKRLSGGGSE